MENTYKIGISNLGGKISCWWSQPYGLPRVHYQLSDFKVVSINEVYYLCAKIKCTGYMGYPVSFFTLKIDDRYLYNHRRIPVWKFLIVNMGHLKDGYHTIYLQFWNDFCGFFGKPSLHLKFKVPLSQYFEMPKLPFYNEKDILNKICEKNISSKDELLKSFGLHQKTVTLSKGEYGVLHIKTQVPSGTTLCVVNDKDYCQSISGYVGGTTFCEYRIPLMQGNNNIYSKYDFKYSVSTLKNCEPHSVRELKIHKSTLYYISYDKPAIGIFKLKRTLYQQNASGCTSLAGGNIVTGWIAVKFPGSYCVVTGTGYRILPNVHPFDIIDVSQSKLYVKKEQYATVTCTLEKRTNSIYATFKSDKPCNFTAVAYYNDKPFKEFSVNLTNHNRLSQTVIVPLSKEGKYCIAPKGQNKELNSWKIKV